MANSSSGVTPQQYLQQMNSPFHCKECGISLNSAESLEVHLQYHKENLLKNWAVQAQSSTSTNPEETNNNNNSKNNISKRELNPNNTIAAAADSSDSMQKKSPDYSRATPETVFGHPPTPQSYQSASSPYQENSSFPTNFQNYPIKIERHSPTNQFYSNYPEQYFSLDHPNQQFNQESFVHKTPYRYHPYNQTQNSPYDRQAQVPSSSPAYPPQPTPSPSPKQCDKCGYVCDSATQLIEHLNIAHPATPAVAPHLAPYHQTNQQHFMFEHVVIKQEDPTQSEILDLDSHKVVHNVYNEDEKRQNGDPNPHSVSAMLNSWPSPQQRLFTQNIPEQQQQQQKLFPPHQEFIGNNVTTTTTTTNQEGLNQNYRPFEQMTSPTNNSVISSTQLPTNAIPQPTPVGKGANWKSNEARRPKTYNCTACNKWFTSSGHLKRHYNTTLHKNAVKSSGQPDPAGLPISAHHHPTRETSSKQEERPQSSNSGDEVRNEDATQYDRLGTISGLNVPYDRQPSAAPNIHSPMGSPMQQQHPSPHISNGSPPNGDAGPSTNNLGGLLTLTTPSISTPHGGFNIPAQHMMSMDNNNQYQMYPNELAPHVMPAMVITTNNHNITGEYQFSFQQRIVENNQPLPSFAQIQAHRFNNGYESANVGGRESATAPLTNYYETNLPDETILYKNDELTVITQNDSSPKTQEYILGYSPNERIQEEDLSMISMTSENESKIMEENKMQIMDDIKLRLEAQPKSPEKAHTKRDYEENTTGIHLITSTTSKPGLHKCYDCDKIFNKACYLTQHNKTFHSGDKPFKCTRCGKRFSCEITYQEHLTKHAGDKPHKCELCPKQFNHKTDLRRHMCLHTGQKPYACETCGKGFIRKDHMMKHCETHVRKTQSKLMAIR
ncbi:uncharacterized protein LOC130901802 [Diorhabda carinulata]|uniref:uncharacterized protein LOC130901802 n=1 Tax=Diorhabda carinulata TaxID=1163345 RepID=UPI0025A0F77C|nr:uncharacterized protein LOC130901802 [Diorhabda carinulata]